MTFDAAPSHRPTRIARALRLLAAGLVLTAAGLAQADEYDDVNALARAGKTEEAMGKADAYIAQKPRDPQMRFLRGVLLTQQGRQTDAIAAFTSLTQEFPELPEPYNNLAALYAGQSQFDQARVALEMALKLKPDYATAQENLGDVYARLAAQAYARTQTLEPANTTAGPKLTLVQQLTNAGSAPTSAAPTAPVRRAVRQ